MLEDHAGASAQFHQFVFVELADVHLIDQHPAAAGLFQTIDGADQRRLACAAAADDAENLATLDGQVDAAQRLHRALFAVVGLAQIDEAHMGAVQLRVQLGLLRQLSCARGVEWQLPLRGCCHSFHPTW